MAEEAIVADGVAECEGVSVDHPTAGTISAIDKKSVHRICSGQVVLTLATAVKELLENSIDAGATIIEIKLKEYGSETIEVTDNGAGVKQDNFQGLTLKHHTSKLQDFADLLSVETFGFRGEALSSLCALCDMTITSRHQDASVGTRLEYDQNGKITRQTAQARQVGTSVVLQNLFYTLPVRHKEFQRNVKKEFVKMIQILNSYCIISTGVRITCSNITGKGNRSTVVSSKGNTTIHENISNVFGPKQLQSILEFTQHRPGDDVCSEFGLKLDGPSLFCIEGYVSKCEHGQGRSSTDRQFFFINGRPFDSTKLSKVINEVYHQYNRHQYPFVVLKIAMQKDGVDVNVTPDKRQVFMEGEKQLMAIVKASLVRMFEPTTSILQIQPLPAAATRNIVCGEDVPRMSRHASLEKPTGVSSLLKLKRTFSSAFARELKDPTDHDPKSARSPNTQAHFKQRKLDCFVSSNDSSFTNIKQDKDCDIITKVITMDTDSDIGAPSYDETDNISDTPLEQSSQVVEENVDDNTQHAIESRNILFNTQLKEYSLGNFKVTEECVKDHIPESLNDENELEVLDKKENVNIDHIDESGDCKNVLFKNQADSHTISGGHENEFAIITHSVTEIKDLKCREDQVKHKQEVLRDKTHDSDALLVIPHGCHGDNIDKGHVEVIQHGCHGDDTDTDIQLDSHGDAPRQEKVITFSMEQFRQKLQSKKEQAQTKEKYARAFRATINPTDNLAAENELQKEIKKSMFSEMEILGQFNLGFIIARLDQDLFIVDQHATDEKYNFEMLQRHTVIQSQRLIAPLNLELTSASEIILMDNVDIFKKNGFEFVIDENAVPTQRVKLLSTPVSKNWSFGKEDIEEMIFMLTDSPGVQCRPSRVRAMFASRSCRKSIMIGTTLNKAEMKKNCPHGRPTMRHLINLDMLPQ